MQYSIKLDAEQAAEKVDHEYHPFCPLINDECNHKCVCFAPAVVKEKNDYETKKPVYVVHGGFCDNAMFSGEVYNQN